MQLQKQVPGTQADPYSRALSFLSLNYEMAAVATTMEKNMDLESQLWGLELGVGWKRFGREFRKRIGMMKSGSHLTDAEVHISCLFCNGILQVPKSYEPHRQCVPLFTYMCCDGPHFAKNTQENSSHFKSVT